MNMKIWLAGLAIAASAYGQTPDVKIPPIPDIDFQNLQMQIDTAMAQMKDLTTSADKIRIDPHIDRLKDSLAFLQKRDRSNETDRDYESGTRALDNRHYDEAISRFDRVIANNGSRADGALYWRAYALNRLGRRDEALAALTSLRQQFPNSPWVKDGQALEVEVRQSNGKPVAPSDEANDDLKLMAISSLMNADPERAIPLLEGVLKGPASPQVKDRAMFVLTQNNSPQAKTILMQFAKGAGNPDLQERAIRYIGMTATPEARQQLATIYASTANVNAKKAIIRSMNSPSASGTLLDIAKNEKNPELRRAAIRQLGVVGGAAQAAQLYASGQSPEDKDEIINALFVHGDAKDMVDLARKEPDPERKKFIVSRLAQMHSKDATDYMMELLK